MAPSRTDFLASAIIFLSAGTIALVGYLGVAGVALLAWLLAFGLRKD